MKVLPFMPLQAGYGAQFNDGVSRIPLPGGKGRNRVTSIGDSDLVHASWNLTGKDYSMFMGFYRDWGSTAEAFQVDLMLHSHELKRYTASFIPQSLQLVEKKGAHFLVSAQLEVHALPEFTDADLDYWRSVVSLLIIYGGYAQAMEVLNLLDKLVNEDLPHE